MKGVKIEKVSTLGKPTIKETFKYNKNLYARKSDGEFLILGQNDPVPVTCGTWAFVKNEEVIKILKGLV